MKKISKKLWVFKMSVQVEGPVLPLEWPRGTYSRAGKKLGTNMPASLLLYHHTIKTAHHTMATETKESTLSTGKPTPKLFLHVTFETPQPVGGGEEDVERSDCDGDKVMGDSGSSDQSTPTLTLITKQKFDASNCKTAEIGLPDGVQPVKVRCFCFTHILVHLFLLNCYILFEMMCNISHFFNLYPNSNSRKQETTRTQACMIMDHYHNLKRGDNLQISSGL